MSVIAPKIVKVENATGGLAIAAMVNGVRMKMVDEERFSAVDAEATGTSKSAAECVWIISASR